MWRRRQRRAQRIALIERAIREVQSGSSSNGLVGNPGTDDVRNYLIALYDVTATDAEISAVMCRIPLNS